MYSACPRTKQWLNQTFRYWTQVSCRYVSTTSAINRGLRATKDASIPERKGHKDGRAPNRISQSSSKQFERGRLFDRGSVRRTKEELRPSPHHDPSRQPLHRPIRSRSEDDTDRQPRRNITSRPTARSAVLEKDGRSDGIPPTVHYTTSASVFLYGAHTVFSALRSGRRKFYHLHLFKRLDGDDRQLNEIQRLAKVNNVPITRHKFATILNKMSEDRPHNGIVLEASRLPSPPVASLGPWNGQDGTIKIDLEHQTAEDQAINGTASSIPSSMKWANSQASRHPLIIMLDGITDPQNVGSILRTCYFYSVDAVAIATNTCAPLTSSALAKASSGACEAIPILAIKKPSAFVVNSSKAGWRVFAAVAPDPAALKTSAVRQHTTESLAYSKPLAASPCILMLGSEDKGLPDVLRNKAGDAVSIESGRATNERLRMGIDSVNVSVAAGALLESFLRPRGKLAKPKGDGDLGFQID